MSYTTPTWEGNNLHYRSFFFTLEERKEWAGKVRRLGYWMVRQAMVRRGASIADVTWVLVAVLTKQGV